MLIWITYIFPFWMDVLMFQTSTRQHMINFKKHYIKLEIPRHWHVSYCIYFREMPPITTASPPPCSTEGGSRTLICYWGTGNSPICGTNRHCVSPASAGKMNCSLVQGSFPSLPCMSAWCDRVSFSNIFADFLKRYCKSFQAITAFSSSLFLVLLMRETAETLTGHGNGQQSSEDLRQQWAEAAFY